MWDSVILNGQPTSNVNLGVGPARQSKNSPSWTPCGAFASPPPRVAVTVNRTFMVLTGRSKSLPNTLFWQSLTTFIFNQFQSCHNKWLQYVLWHGRCLEGLDNFYTIDHWLKTIWRRLNHHLEAIAVSLCINVLFDLFVRLERGNLCRKAPRGASSCSCPCATRADSKVSWALVACHDNLPWVYLSLWCQVMPSDALGCSGCDMLFSTSLQKYAQPVILGWILHDPAAAKIQSLALTTESVDLPYVWD